MAKSCRNGCGTPATPDHQSTAPNEEGSPRSNTHVQMLSQATTTNITNISFGNVAQVINISGTNQTVHIPQPTVQILQQSIGTDGVSSNAGTQSSHHFPHQSQPVWSGSAPSHLPSESLTSQGSPPEFAEGRIYNKTCTAWWSIRYQKPSIWEHIQLFYVVESKTIICSTLLYMFGMLETNSISVLYKWPSSDCNLSFPP